MNQPVILCGLGRVGWPVLEYLKAAGLPVVAIDMHARPDDPRLAGVRFIAAIASARKLMRRGRPGNARGVLILTADDLVNISTTLMIRHLHPRRAHRRSALQSEPDRPAGPGGAQCLRPERVGPDGAGAGRRRP